MQAPAKPYNVRLPAAAPFNGVPTRAHARMSSSDPLQYLPVCVQPASCTVPRQYRCIASYLVAFPYHQQVIIRRCVGGWGHACPRTAQPWLGAPDPTRPDPRVLAAAACPSLACSSSSTTPL